MSRCCIHCFTNEFIQSVIRNESEKGYCNYCNMDGSKSAWVADIEIVGSFISERLGRCYRNAVTEEVPYIAIRNITRSIEDVLVLEENIFSDDLHESGRTSKLVRDMFQASAPSIHDIAQGAFDEWEGGDAQILKIDEFYVSERNNELRFKWEDFKYNVMHINRFFDVGPHESRVDKLRGFKPILTKPSESREDMLKRFIPIFTKMTVTLPAETRIWRARYNPDGHINQDTLHLECGPPPRNKAIPLRMNPSGISYFYGAEDIDTCKAEIRLEPGDQVLCGLFSTTRDLTIVDLSKKVHVGRLSFFDPEYDHAYNWASLFVESFIEEVSRPIHKDESSIEYVPTQILCEYIRKLGYHGVKFKSSITGRMNYTLFCGRKETTHEQFWYSEWRHPSQVPEFMEWLSLVDSRQEIM